ncbi:hypothetical protein EDD18DRAFT_1112415 [Armillaria luteobubalina]|uniref:Uncharacterized protein n=1 Tax=Armillaria luteobubalina TaxID=153913 RepID=A0AA39PER1_9AGAR|nr:hypothetical protein EDD18DRAFT_1112415 [Armillaria luteobubalina]
MEHLSIQMHLTVDQKAYLTKHAAMFCFLETRYHLQQDNKWFESLWECFVVYWPMGDLSQTGIDTLKQQVKNDLQWLFWSLDRATQEQADTWPVEITSAKVGPDAEFMT